MGHRVPPHLSRGDLLHHALRHGQGVTPLLGVLAVGERTDRRVVPWVEEVLWREFTRRERALARLATFFRVEGAGARSCVMPLAVGGGERTPLHGLDRGDGMSVFLRALRPTGPDVDFVVYGGCKVDFGYGIALSLDSVDSLHDGLRRLLEGMDHVLGPLAEDWRAAVAGRGREADELSLRALRSLEQVLCDGDVPVQPRVWRPDSALVARLAEPALLSKANVLQRLNELVADADRMAVPQQDTLANGPFIGKHVGRVRDAGRCSLWRTASTLLYGQSHEVLKSVAWGGRLGRDATCREDVRRALESLGLRAPEEDCSIARMAGAGQGWDRAAWRRAAESLAKDIVCTLADRDEEGWWGAVRRLREEQLLHPRKSAARALEELTLGAAVKWINALAPGALRDEEAEDDLRQAANLLGRCEDSVRDIVHNRSAPLPRETGGAAELAAEAMRIAMRCLRGLPWHMEATSGRDGHLDGPAWSHGVGVSRRLRVVPELDDSSGPNALVWVDSDGEGTRLMRLP